MRDQYTGPEGESFLERKLDEDGLSQTLAAHGISRREALRFLGGGLSAALLTPYAAGEAQAQNGRGRACAFLPAVEVGPHEKVMIVYFTGRGKFSGDVRYITLNMEMFDLCGNHIGQQSGVHESQSTLFDLLGRPAPPPLPIDQPPVPHQRVLEWTKGVWTFRDGSAIYAVGPAQSHLVPFADGSFLFMVTTAQIVTNGTGRYAGVFGVKQATGSTFIPREMVGRFPAPGLEFQAKTVEVFRIIKSGNVA